MGKERERKLVGRSQDSFSFLSLALFFSRSHGPAMLFTAASPSSLMTWEQHDMRRGNSRAETQRQISFASLFSEGNGKGGKRFTDGQHTIMPIHTLALNTHKHKLLPS